MPRGKFYLRCCDAMPHVCSLAAVVTVDQLSIGRDRVCCPHCRCNDDVGGTHTHTHTRLTALCPGLPRRAGTRKVKPVWILLKHETVIGNGISWAICKSAPCSDR